MFRRVRPATVLSALVLVAGCTGASSSPTPTPLSNGGGSATPAPIASASTGSAAGSSAPSALDPCALLTQAEVATATGHPVGAGQSQNDGQQCMWEYADPSDQFTGLDASLAINADPEAWREAQQGGPLIKKADGVGDEAYYVEAGNVVLLDFRKGSQLFDIGMNVAGSLKTQLTAAAQEAVEKQMALDALQRIP